MDKYYLPMIEKFAYHLPCVILLEEDETSSDISNHLTPGDIETSCDYAKRLTLKNNKEIMSKHSGNHISL